MESALKFITGGLLAGWELSVDDVSRWIQGTSKIFKLDGIRERKDKMSMIKFIRYSLGRAVTVFDTGIVG